MVRLERIITVKDCLTFFLTILSHIEVIINNTNTNYFLSHINTLIRISFKFNKCGIKTVTKKLN